MVEGRLTAEAEARLVAELTSSMTGTVIDRQHPAYDRARRVWNGLIDRYPAVIAQCTSTADVVAAVRAARAGRRRCRL
jgi:FAD/FMN-containing dehydrogenase